MAARSSVSSLTPAAEGLNPMQVFHNALTGQPTGSDSVAGSGSDDVADPYTPILDAMTVPDAYGTGDDAYPLAIQGLLPGGAVGPMNVAPSSDALGQSGLNTAPSQPQPGMPIQGTSEFAVMRPSELTLKAMPSDAGDDQPDAGAPAYDRGEAAFDAPAVADAGASPANPTGKAESMPMTSEPMNALAAGNGVMLPQSQPPEGQTQPPRLGPVRAANASGLSPKGPSKALRYNPAVIFGKGPPKVPDYDHFSKVFSDWAKSHSDAPRYVPASNWKRIAPDPSNLEPESKYGPYTRITFHDTGSDDTPQSVDELHTNNESYLHHLGREVKNAFHAERYHNGDIGYHFLIGADGTIYEGRPLTYEGAHVWGHNPANIGVAFLGDYSSNPLSDAQLNSAKVLVGVLNRTYHIGQNANGQPYIFSHKDLAPSSGEHARPVELVGANQQMDQIKAWSQTRRRGR